MIDKVKEETENVINTILDEGISTENAEMLYKVMDIHKDACNENYWKEKIDMYRRGRYGNYDDNYGARSRDSRGRYQDSGRVGRYMGHTYIDGISDEYGRYMESRGRYGASDESTEALEYMLKSAYDFMCHIADQAQSQEEVEMVKKYARKISEL